MADRVDWLMRVKDAERERIVVGVALDLLDRRLTTDPSELTERGLNAADLAAARSHLDRTFLLRMVTEFEAALRDYWRGGVGRRSEPQLKTLIDGVASRRKLPTGLLADVHAVRERRNALVHRDGPPPAGGATPAADRRTLNRFLAALPPRW